MKTIIVSDFDGTVTTRDSLYGFFEEYATEEWKVVEELWAKGEISSKECLIREFELVPNLCEKLINEFTSKIELDPYFKEFNDYRIKKNLDFIVVSDGIDYFINKILENHGIEGIKIISNHAEFTNEKFTLSFPNDYQGCKNDAGTCKCKVVEDLRKDYDNIIYVGDGVSDFCVSDKADKLFAKKSLLRYCTEKNIPHAKYETYKDILSTLN